MKRNFQDHISSLPPEFGDFARAYVQKLAGMSREEIEAKFGGTALEKIKEIFPEKFAMKKNSVDEDFKSENVGKPPDHRRQRDHLHSSLEGKQQLRTYMEERSNALKNRPRRALFGIRLSDDHGKSWKIRALCLECYHSIEPPTRAKNEGVAVAVKCDWCGALNEN